MKFCYYDESGDDGFPDYSSPLFVLTGVYFDHLEWKELHERVVELRRSLKVRYGFPVKLEFHCNQFLLDKDPYRNLGYTHEQKIEIVSSICEFIGSLNLKIINILINKKAIEKFEFDVLKTALTYSIQRVENDLNPGRNPDARFLIITDEGRVAKMRNTTRAIQRINYIPSQYGGPALRREIKSLIEDPLPKDSKQSYFIQIADSVAYLVYLYGMRKLQIGEFPNRLKNYLTSEQLEVWLDLLKPSFNLNAASDNAYGIKIHPKKKGWPEPPFEIQTPPTSHSRFQWFE